MKSVFVFIFGAMLETSRCKRDIGATCLLIDSRRERANAATSHKIARNGRRLLTSKLHHAYFTSLAISLHRPCRHGARCFWKATLFFTRPRGRCTGCSTAGDPQRPCTALSTPDCLAGSRHP
ncbi:uncharacterized protein C8Q71DRAFT_137925 [Rhodofomes roseus]|uniref:Secreted protein n=1 Tax=Rhodofomes roseus TaxID=34475 RepID=A0ABQ8KBU9_9APHY|nr:uncharacterized protein C8Q71DRAFT_137925 [Rhodofomes roseus]KAH9835026.1 hypothetical protein C8Q71DRAFT_137925 [Rhodofomes roseus]